MAENTFLGLQPYTEADAYRFKGRAEETQELFRLIVRNDYTVCYAESGEGKTSLLNAGVFPLLRENMYFPIAITFTSDDYQVTPDNFSTIIDRCIKDSIAEYNEKNKGINVEYKLCSTDFQGLDCQAELQQELNKYSWWKLRNYKPQAMGLTFTPVFVFDQFEEVFNMPGSIVWTKKFFDWLEDVSSDSCPDEIAKKIRAIIGTNAAFPSIKEEKDFKAVFSLRKEFIGELDYWGMQKCFIPSLKDNRYCLKALTYDGAQKVMLQQQRFEKSKVDQVLHYFVQQYSHEPEKTIQENLPVIPALLLSIVCDFWEKDLDYFSDIDDNGVDKSLNKILEKFYDEALSDIVNELSPKEVNSQLGAIHEDIETAIFALVDSNGKRVRRKSSELSYLDFDAKYKEILSDKRIIKISKIDSEDYVEVVHDSICPIIAKKKELKEIEEAEKAKTKAEEAKKHEEQREDITSSLFLLILFAFVVWLLSSVFRNWDVFTNVRAFSLTSLCTFSNLVILPFIIYATIKRFKITSWLSVYGLLSNMVLMVFFLVGQTTELGLRISVAAVSLGIPAITLLYSFRHKLFGIPNKSEIRRIEKSIPILLFFLFASSFVFYLCVFNNASWFTHPRHSAWGVVVVPILLHEIVTLLYKRGKQSIELFIYGVLLGLLAYNNSHTPFLLPIEIVYIIAVVLFVLILWSRRELSLVKRCLAVSLELIVICVLFIMNLGFNPTKIEYSTVECVNNWLDVIVQDEEKKIGIVSAYYGDTLLPCLFDSIKGSRYYLTSRELEFVGDTIDSKSLFTYQKETGSSYYSDRFLHNIEVEILKDNNEHNIKLTLQDSIRVYSAKAYRQVRNAILNYLVSGRIYSVDKVSSLDSLMTLQTKELETTLKDLNNSKQIDDSLVVSFSKSFARSFYLCMLKDRILQEDFINLLSLVGEFYSLYFYEMYDNIKKPDYSITYNISIRINDYYRKYDYKFMISELYNNKRELWHGYIKTLLALDMNGNQKNAETHYHNIVKETQRLNAENNNKIKKNKQIIESIAKKEGTSDLSDLEDALKLYGDIIKSNDSTKSKVYDQIDKIEIEKKQMDFAYRNLISGVFNTLTNVAKYNENSYSFFYDICEQLLAVSYIRLYKESIDYLQKLKEIDESHGALTRELENVLKQEEKIKQLKTINFEEAHSLNVKNR